MRTMRWAVVAAPNDNDIYDDPPIGDGNNNNNGGAGGGGGGGGDRDGDAKM